MKYLTFTEVNPQLFKVFFKDKELGDLVFCDSEFFFFEDFSPEGSGWSWYTLAEISEKLKELNEKQC